jgi:hypothetical protein
VLAVLLALFAIGDPAGEPLLFQVLKASLIGGELPLKILNRVS